MAVFTAGRRSAWRMAFNPRVEGHYPESRIPACCYQRSCDLSRVGRRDLVVANDDRPLDKARLERRSRLHARLPRRGVSSPAPAVASRNAIEADWIDRELVG